MKLIIIIMFDNYISLFYLRNKSGYYIKRKKEKSLYISVIKFNSVNFLTKNYQTSCLIV